MKKEMSAIVLVFAVFFLLILPFSLAEINLNPLAKTIYNKGDSLKINGYVRSADSGNYPLTVYLTCDTNQLQILTKNMNVLKDKDYPISAEVTIPFSMSGDCQVAVNFGQEQANSELFKITKALKGTFTLVPLSVQLGDEISFTGTVTKLNGDNVNGVGTLYIEKDDKNYYTSNLEIKNSKFEFKSRLESIPEGSYHINLAVNDLFGNEEFFWNAATLNVYQKFKINALLDKQQYNPEESLKLRGTVERTIGTKIEKAEAKITLDENEYITEIVNNKFELEIPLSSGMKSFYHDLAITVTDEFGNMGEKTLRVYIIPKEVKLESGVSKDLFSPKEIITFSPKIYDQAADTIQDTVLLTLIDSKNSKVFEKQIPTNEDFSFKLNQFASPGTWQYTLKSKTLAQKDSFNVDTVEDIQVSLQGQILKVRNIGNINYDPRLEITATDSKNIPTTFYVTTGIKPNQELLYPLYKGLKPDTYEIYINNKGEKFENINVADTRDLPGKVTDFFKQATGAVVGAPGTSNDYKPLAFTLLVLGALLLSLFFVTFRRKARYEISRDRERRLGQQRLQQIQSTPESKPRFGKATQDDVRDFRQRMVKNIQEEQGIKKQNIESDSDNRTVRSSIERKIIYDKYKRE
ncbi:MAG: hypothetical protein AABW41_04045 [Nanoarchaeota archaeon]